MTLERDRRGGGHAGSGAGGGAARRPVHREGAGRGAGSCRSPRSIICRATSRRTSSPAERRANAAGAAVRAAVSVPDRQRRAHAARARHRARRVRGPRPHARRRGRRGVRQGREDARAGLSRAARRSSAWPRTAIRRRSPSPARAASAPAAGRGTSRQAFARSLDFSFAGVKTALLYRLRELSERRGAGAGRRPGGLLSGGDRRQPDPARRAGAGAHRARAPGGGRRGGRQRRAAAAAEGAGRDASCPGARAVHRQRRHDRERRPLHRAAALPATTWRSTPMRPGNGRDDAADGSTPARTATCATRR